MSSVLPKPVREHRGINWSKLDWPVVIGIAAMHLGVIAAPFYFTWSGVAIALALIVITAMCGITLCFHRLLTHRSFKTPKWFEYLITLCGCLTWQGGPIQWVGTHRIHHKHSDEDEDPHSPTHGFTWAHMFWCMHREPEGMNPRDAAKDLMRDPIHRVINSYFYVPQFILMGLLYVAGEYARQQGLHASGLSWVVWGICVRTVFVYHGTWFVNSAAHTWGYRNFETRDNSTNLWWVAVLSFGEGWHNNHHAQQRSAKHGMRWHEIDLTYITIKLMSYVGLAWDIVQPDLSNMKPELAVAHHGTPAEDPTLAVDAAPAKAN